VGKEFFHSRKKEEEKRKESKQEVKKGLENLLAFCLLW
jgi:hypothetical protein